MHTIISKLENNTFNNVLIKKGKNLISDKKCIDLLQNDFFKNYVMKGLIKILEKEKKEIKEINKENTPDYENMNYNDLVKYAKSKGIDTNKKKKAQIIEELRRGE